MKKLIAFRKPDGSLTPDMTLEEFMNGKHKEYGVTNEDIRNIMFRYHKTLIESVYPGVKLELKNNS